MSIVTNTQTTYDTTGNREDLSDIIAMIAPVDAHFYNACGKGDKCKATKHEWQTDTLRAGTTGNATLEGDIQGTLVAVVARTRLANYTQIQKEEFSVTKTQEAVDAAGVSSELAYQKTKHTKVLMKDVEQSFLSETLSATASGAGSSSAARSMKGALNWCTTNVDKAGDATVASDGTISGGTSRTLTQDLIDNTCQNIFTAGGDPKIMYCGPFQKRQISAFINSGNYRKLIEAKKLDSAVDVYVNDFFALSIKAHRNMDTSVVFIPDMDYWKKSTLRPMAVEDLPSTADAYVKRIIVEHTLEARNEAASGRVVNLATS